jgi:hypothetical protein
MSKSFIFKKSALVVAMVMATGYVGSAAAHDIPSGAQAAPWPTVSLATATDAYDVYHTTCYTATALAIPDIELLTAASRIQVGVSRTSGTSTLKATVGHIATGAGAVATNWTGQASCTDSTTSANPLFPGTYCNGAPVTLIAPATKTGNGDYNVVVSKSGSGISTYAANLHCQALDALGTVKHTGTGALFSAPATPTADYIQVINY